MAMKEVLDLSADVTISLGGTNKKTGKKNPTEIEGYYIGRREIEDKKKKSGVSYIHFFQTSKGNVGVWGKTDLDNKLNGMALGTMVRAAYDRMVPTPNGDMYKYKVAFDDANTIDVGVTASAGSANTELDLGSDDLGEDAGEDVGNFGDAFEGGEETDVPVQRISAVSRQQTEALLRNAGKKR
jgi:hypothetical protein